MADKDATWRAYLQRYDRVYDPVANAKASEEKATAEARRKAMNARGGKAKR